MRILDFRVDHQALCKLPGSDFSKIVAGSSGYLRAKFHFSEDWDEYIKRVAHFVGEDGTEGAVPLNENNECDIPSEVLTGREFKVTMYGAGEIRKDEETDKFPVIGTSTWKVKQEVN